MGKKAALEPSSKEKFDAIVHHMVVLANEAKRLVKQAKQKFDEADDETKRKVVKGLAGATALMAAVVGVQRIKSKHRKAKKRKAKEEAKKAKKG